MGERLSCVADPYRKVDACSRTLSATSATARSTPSELQNVTKRNLSLKVKGPRCANTLFSGRSSGSQIAL